jgi:hypothetical protein
MKEERPTGEYEWCALRVERRGESWRVTYEEKGVKKASEWRERRSFWPSIGLFLGYLREFTFRGMGRIPIALNSEPREPRGAA